MNIAQREGSVLLQVPYQRINEIINGKRSITPSTALRLAKMFEMSEDFWLNLQLRVDLYRAKQQESEILQSIKPLSQIANRLQQVSTSAREKNAGII